MKAFLTKLSIIGLIQQLCCLTVAAEVITDGSMGVMLELGGPDYQISSDLGRVQGNNLFHSFNQFNLYAGESASFSGDATIANVISRVTGGNYSFIDGVLQSTIPDANLFFINPAGVLFGENASLDVDGSFFASTANALNFSDGATFHADTYSASTLSIAEPASFGFVGNMRSPIVVQGGRLITPPGRTIGLMAGDIQVSGSENGLIGGDSGNVLLSTLVGDGNIALSGEASALESSSAELSGSTILIVNSGELSTGGESGGYIRIDGDHIILDNAKLYANTYGSTAGEGIMLNGREHVEINGSAVQSATVGAGDAGSIDIVTPFLVVDNESVVLASSYSEGNAGNIRVQADNALIQGGSTLYSQAQYTGRAGDIRFQVSEDLNIIGEPTDIFDTRLSTSSYAAGSAGDIRFDVKNLGVSGGLIDAASNVQGGSGDVLIQSDNFTLTNSAQIITATSTNMQAGNIIITATEDINISGVAEADVWTGLFAISASDGIAGEVTLSAPSMTINNAWIDATTSGTGDAGIIHLDIADSLLLDNGNIRVSTMGAGNGGSLMINTDRMTATGNTHIGAMSTSAGYGGNIKVEARTISLLEGGEITNEAYYFAPGTRDITVSASESIHIVGESESKDPNPGSDRVSTGIFSFTGDVTVSAPEILIEQSGAISARTYNDTNAGDLTITTDTLSLYSGAQINASSFGSSGYTGLGGSVVVNASEKILIDGQSGGRYSGILAATRSSGNAGEITITSPIIEIRNEGSINTSTGVFGEGSAGNINLYTDTLYLSSDGGLLSSSVGYGDGGDILVNVADRLIIDGGYISAYGYRDGASGVISINSPSIWISDGIIRTSSYGFSDAGNITIQTQEINLNNASTIESTSTNYNVNAGTVSISASDIINSNQSIITTEAEQGSGGNIELAAHTVNLIDAPITATVAGGEGGGGNVTIDATAVGAVLDSDITARADQGLGGKIIINTDVFLRADTVDLDASSNVEGNDGIVEINAPEMDLSGSVNELTTDFLNIASLMENRCIAQATVNRSSLVISGQGGLAPAPDDYLMGSTIDLIRDKSQVGVTIDLPNTSRLVSVKCKGF
jgi:filamentous hemagglutinin family protein